MSTVTNGVNGTNGTATTSTNGTNNTAQQPQQPSQAPRGPRESRATGLLYDGTMAGFENERENDSGDAIIRDLKVKQVDAEITHVIKDVDLTAHPRHFARNFFWCYGTGTDNDKVRFTLDGKGKINWIGEYRSNLPNGD